MPDKNKPSQKPRAHKESQGKNGGGGKVRLTELEKVLVCTGGMAHRCRPNSKASGVPTKRDKKLAEQVAKDRAAAKTSARAKKEQDRLRREADAEERLSTRSAR